MTDRPADQPADQPLADRIALVTGATRGIGAATAVALAAAGAHVVAVGRTEGALEDLDDAIKAVGGAATLVPLNVTDGEGIDRLGGALFQRYGRLDVFVGNAGALGPLTPLSHLVPKDWDKVLAVNLTANLRLIRSLDPLLRLSPAGRAVLISSSAAYGGRAYWGPYAITKAGLDAAGRAWAAESVSSPLKVNMFNPGPARTRMRAQAFPGEDPMALPGPEEVAAAILPLCLPAFTETGKIYDFPTRSLLSFQRPA